MDWLFHALANWHTIFCLDETSTFYPCFQMVRSIPRVSVNGRCFFPFLLKWLPLKILFSSFLSQSLFHTSVNDFIFVEAFDVTVSNGRCQYSTWSVVALITLFTFQFECHFQLYFLCCTFIVVNRSFLWFSVFQKCHPWGHCVAEKEAAELSKLCCLSMNCTSQTVRGVTPATSVIVMSVCYSQVICGLQSQ